MADAQRFAGISADCVSYFRAAFEVPAWIKWVLKIIRQGGAGCEVGWAGGIFLTDAGDNRNGPGADLVIQRPANEKGASILTARFGIGAVP